jgi:phage terminase large subunit
MNGTTVRLPQLRPLQRELLDAMARWNVWVCHRRFGKTLLCLCLLIKHSHMCPHPAPRYAYLAPLFRQAKQISWDYLRRFAAQIPGAVPNEAELRLDLPWNNARIQLLGADNPDSLRGMYLDGCILDEYAQMQPRAWTQVIRPALSDRLGWAIKVGTPYGKNHFYFDWREAVRAQAEGDTDYHAALYRASETGVIPQAELDSARQTMRASFGDLAGDADYEQEYECQWEAAIPGAYYAEELRLVDVQRRITHCPYDPTYPVYTAWDLGVNDATAIWFFQCIGRQICLLSYYEASGYGAPHYAEYLASQPYQGHYRGHLLPHDGGHHEWGTGERREVTLQRLVQGEVYVQQRPGLDTSINSVRVLFPRLVFDQDGCERGIEALRNYHHRWDTQRKVFLSMPEHNWACHGADALRTLAVSLDLVDQIEKQFTRTLPPEQGPFDWLTGNAVRGYGGQGRLAWMG